MLQEEAQVEQLKARHRDGDQYRLDDRASIANEPEIFFPEERLAAEADLALRAPGKRIGGKGAGQSVAHRSGTEDHRRCHQQRAGSPAEQQTAQQGEGAVLAKT